MTAHQRAAGGIFAGALAISVIAHAVVLGTARIAGSPTEIPINSAPAPIEIALVEIPPPPEPPPPEPPPPPEEPPSPPEPEEPVLTSETTDLPPPAPTPTPPPTPRPTPTPTPKPAPRPAPTPAKAKPAPARRAAPAAPSGAVVEARPDYSRNPPPRYPELARRNGWQGRILIRATIGPQGRATSVSLRRSSGYSVLDQAALQAVRGWRFRPKTIGGRAVESVVEVPVNFSLKR